MGNPVIAYVVISGFGASGLSAAWRIVLIVAWRLNCRDVNKMCDKLLGAREPEVTASDLLDYARRVLEPPTLVPGLRGSRGEAFGRRRVPYSGTVGDTGRKLRSG